MVFTFDTCPWLVTFIKREKLNYSHQEPLTRWTLIEDTLMWKKMSWKTNKLIEKKKNKDTILNSSTHKNYSCHEIHKEYFLISTLWHFFLKLTNKNSSSWTVVT